MLSLGNFGRKVMKNENFWLFINTRTCPDKCSKWFKMKHVKLKECAQMQLKDLNHTIIIQYIGVMGCYIYLCLVTIFVLTDRGIWSRVRLSCSGHYNFQIWVFYAIVSKECKKPLNLMLHNFFYCTWFQIYIIFTGLIAKYYPNWYLSHYKQL